MGIFNIGHTQETKEAHYYEIYICQTDISRTHVKKINVDMIYIGISTSHRHRKPTAVRFMVRLTVAMDLVAKDLVAMCFVSLVGLFGVDLVAVGFACLSDVDLVLVGLVCLSDDNLATVELVDLAAVDLNAVGLLHLVDPSKLNLVTVDLVGLMGLIKVDLFALCRVFPSDENLAIDDLAA